MTTETPHSRTAPDGGDLDDLQALVAEQPTPRRPRRSRWWRIGYPVALVLLVLAIPALVFAGLRVILDSTDGQLVRRVDDPSDPGYEAVVVKTPTELVVAVDAEGKLDSVTLLALTSDGTGGVMTIPAGTLVPMEPVSLSLRYIYDTFGLEAFTNSLGDVLDLSFGDVQVVPSTDWAKLTGPAAPITVDNPDPVAGPNGAVVFPQGNIQLSADQVWPYISGRGARESDLARMIRLQAFWEGWIAAVGQKGTAGLNIPTDTGIGHFVSGLVADSLQTETLPVSVTAADRQGNEQFAANTDAVFSAVGTLIPFPEGAPGARPRLRVLDGTGKLDNGVSAAVVLAAAGAQIDVVGNARSYGQGTTQFIYFDDGTEAVAKKLRDALGVGELVRSDQTNSATDLTVVLGEDYVEAAGPSTASVDVPTLGGNGA